MRDEVWMRCTVLAIAISIVSSVAYPAAAFGWMAEFFDGEAPGQALYEEMAIHPQGVRSGDTVYVVYQGADLAPQLVTFKDTNRGTEVGGPYRVGENPLTQTWNPVDTHGGPAIFIDVESETVNVFYGAHGTELKHARAPVDRIGEPDAWQVTNWSSRFDNQKHKALAGQVTYPQVFVDADAEAHLFFRYDKKVGDIPKGSWLHATSVDGGKKWNMDSVPVLVGDPTGGSLSKVPHSWYAHFEPGLDGRIHAVATPKNESSGASPYDRSGVYYMYRDEEGVWRGPADRAIDSSSGVPPRADEPSATYTTVGVKGVELHELEYEETQCTIADRSFKGGPFHNQVTCAAGSPGRVGVLYLEGAGFGQASYKWKFASFDQEEDDWDDADVESTDHFFDASALVGREDGGFDAFLVSGGTTGVGSNEHQYADRGGDIVHWRLEDGKSRERVKVIAESDPDRGVVYNNPQIVQGEASDESAPAVLYAEWNNDAGNFIHKVYLRKADGTKVGKEFFPELARLDGDDRYKTAARVSREGFPLGSDCVVLASGESFPDALAGSTLAQACNAPLLLVSSKGVPKAVEDELKRLKGTRTRRPTAYVLGGEVAIAGNVDAKVKQIGFDVKRVKGTNRYQTAVEVAKLVDAKTPGEPKRAYIVSGELFPDALAAGPLAATQGAPLLFATASGLPRATLEYVAGKGSITSVVIVGGPKAVSSQVEWALRQDAFRVFGNDRYETAAKIAALGIGESDRQGDIPASLGTYRFVVATGENFPDALVGSAYAARVRGPVVLTQPHKLTPAAAAFLDEHARRVIRWYVIGGDRAVAKSPTVEEIALMLHDRQVD